MLSGHISSSKTGKSNISYPIFFIYSMSFIATCCSYVFMVETEKSCSYVFMSKKHDASIQLFSSISCLSWPPTILISLWLKQGKIMFLCLYVKKQALFYIQICRYIKEF